MIMCGRDVMRKRSVCANWVILSHSYGGSLSGNIACVLYE